MNFPIIQISQDLLEIISNQKGWLSWERNLRETKKETNKMRTMPQLIRDFFVGSPGTVCFLVLLLLYIFGGHSSLQQVPVENLAVVVRQKSLVVRRVLVALKAQTSSDYNPSKARASGLPGKLVGGGSTGNGVDRRMAPLLKKRRRRFGKMTFFGLDRGCRNFFKFYVISQSYVYICCLFMFFSGRKLFWPMEVWIKKNNHPTEAFWQAW